MDVKTQASNRWVEHIRKYAKDNSLSYRNAMRSEACKAAYKTPEVTPEPRVELPDPLEVPVLSRSETEVPRIPLPKKVRVKRTAKLVPT